MARGSPPHTRGKGKLPQEAAVLGGITPAYAGKRLMSLALYCSMRDHPRIRGEKVRCWTTPPGRRGSPPHMRGKVQLSLPAHALVGITPAYAGKSNPCRGMRLVGWDHPRIRGEKILRRSAPVKNKGSPPHTRGKDGPFQQISRLGGITPAYAGKSLTGRRLCISCRDHPRIRGEKDTLKVHTNDQVGSPPHTRGKAAFPVVVQLIIGITPAYAGKRL